MTAAAPPLDHPEGDQVLTHLEHLQEPRPRVLVHPDAVSVGGPVVIWPATECPRIRPETLQRDRRSMSDRWFRQEYLCEFSDNDETLFSEELIRKAIKYDVQPIFR